MTEPHALYLRDVETNIGTPEKKWCVFPPRYLENTGSLFLGSYAKHTPNPNIRSCRPVLAANRRFSFQGRILLPGPLEAIIVNERVLLEPMELKVRFKPSMSFASPHSLPLHTLSLSKFSNFSPSPNSVKPFAHHSAAMSLSSREELTSSIGRTSMTRTLPQPRSSSWRRRIR